MTLDERDAHIRAIELHRLAAEQPGEDHTQAAIEATRATNLQDAWAVRDADYWYVKYTSKQRASGHRAWAREHEQALGLKIRAPRNPTLQQAH